MPERLLKTSQVAKILSMHPHTVRAYAEAGAFEGAYKFRGPRAAKNGRGEWRIPETAITAFIDEQRRDYDRSLRTAA